MLASPVQTVFLPDRPTTPPLTGRDAIKAKRVMASYMDALAEQAGFASRSDAVRLWRNAAANKRREADHMERAARGRSVIPEAPPTNPVLTILARHGRVGSARA
ncbi:glycoside hydrolase family 43 protein [Asaia prunellae]|uniref:glycoside hydrolase family 43 protein n=1 Tax=Asaia prunellae TaxID=610245 RepID=UPI000AA5DDE0|nr:glycoside hydrolase family 43 protein [Asaia prunellae]